MIDARIFNLMVFSILVLFNSVDQAVLGTRELIEVETNTE
jgi:hypothetical protein